MMKKYVYLLIPAIFLSGIVSAQTFSIGTKNGISHTTISGRFGYGYLDDAQIRYNRVKVFHDSDPWNISEFKTSSSGYLKQNFGFILNYQFNKNISLQSEFNYEEKGYDFFDFFFGGGVHGYYEINYFTFPVSFTYEIGKSVKYYSYWGASLNMLLKAHNYTSRAYATGAPPPNTIIILDESYIPTEFNKTESGVLCGVGMKIPLGGKVKFIIDMRYNYGVTRAAKNIFASPNTFQNVFNRSLTLCWGVIYKINRKKDTQSQ